VDTLKNLRVDQVITVKEGLGIMAQRYPLWGKVN
jgi:hypothetical protein